MSTTTRADLQATSRFHDILHEVVFPLFLSGVLPSEFGVSLSFLYPLFTIIPYFYFPTRLLPIHFIILSRVLYVTLSIAVMYERRSQQLRPKNHELSPK
jgi:hypothetical protein